MEISGKRFLVVGGAGFIGSHLVEQLLDHGAAQVRIYDNFSRGSRVNIEVALRDSRVEVFPDGGDVLHRDVLSCAMAGMDGVFHLAALWLLQCYKYPRSAFDVNVVGTMNVIESAIDCGVKKMVFSSSASVYGEAITELIREEHPINCREFYGASKACGEMLLKSLHYHGKQSGPGLEYIGLRYMNVYGPRQYDEGAYISVIARMLNALRNGEPPVIHGDGSQAYDFVDVRDCARANILAMRSENVNGFFNVGTGVKTTIVELAAKLTGLWGGRLQARYETNDRPIVRNRVGATKKAAQDLGFETTINLDRGLKELIDWYRVARLR